MQISIIQKRCYYTSWRRNRYKIHKSLYWILEKKPVNGPTSSSVEMPFNRNIRTSLLCSAKHNLNNPKQIWEQLEKRHDRQKNDYDSNSKCLQPHANNQLIFLQHAYERAKIISHFEEPRSYIVEKPDGVVFKRNRVHLKKRTQPTQMSLL